MAIDTPATIAVIGAGPIGLEAALYARFLGYQVNIYERGGVADNVLHRCDASTSFRWGACTTPLGIAALMTQDRSWRPLDNTASLGVRDWIELYLVPLSQTDLLVDSLHTQCEVVSIERPASDEPVADDEVQGFLIRLRTSEGERTDEADIVIDASGPASGTSIYGHFQVAPTVEARQAIATDPARLLTTERDFYVLGSKSAADPTNFVLLEGIAQIRDLFTIIGDRPTLDLYATIAS